MKKLKLLLIALGIIVYSACTNDAEKNSGAETNTDTIDTTAQDSIGSQDTTRTDTTNMPSSGME